MTESAPEPQIIVLGAPPMPGELIASYLRHRLPNVEVTLCASCADLKGGAARGVVLIETTLRTSQNIGETVARVRSGHPQAPILIASASPSTGSAIVALRSGAQGFLPRLTPLSALAGALQSLLAGRTCFPQLVATDRDVDDAREAFAGSGEPASVELAVLQDALAAAGEPPYDGPCRRREGAAKDWSGPERRRAEAQ